MSVILTCYYKPKPGGLCKRLTRSMNALLERGHVVHYLAAGKFPLTHKSCFFHRFPWPESKTDNLLFWFVFHILAPVLLLYLGYRHKITHAYAFGTNYGFALQPLKIFKRIPLTLFLRADVIENHILKGKNKFIILLDTILEGVAIANVKLYAVSNTLLDSVSVRHSFLKPKETGVLQNDISHPAASFQKKAFTVLPLKIAAVGIIEERKNLTLLIKAFSEIKTLDAHLYIFGTGPMKNDISNMVDDFNLSTKITLMGWTEESANIWKEMDILAFPSLHEGSPNAVLEAIAHQTPVVASDIPEHREILPPGCLLDPHDAMAWTRKFIDITDNPAESLLNIYKDCITRSEELTFDWDDRIVKIILS